MKDTSALLADKLPAICTAIDQMVAEVTGARVGFTLVLSPAGRALFSSTMTMEDAIEVTGKFLAQWKAGKPGIHLQDVAASNLIPGAHDIELPPKSSGEVNAATMRVANHYWNLAIDRIVERLTDQFSDVYVGNAVSDEPAEHTLINLQNFIQGLKR